MDKHDRFIAINQTLPGLEDFLRVVLGSEPLSEDANRQRIEFLRRLESVSRPPSLPPRPANLSELYRTRVQQQNETSHSGSLTQDESNVYKNDRTLDPVQFASQQRELSRVANLYKTYAPQTVISEEKGSKNGGLYFPRPSNTTYSRGNTRDSIQSSSSAEDDIYERLSLKSVSPSGAVTPCDGETNTKNEESFMFPSPPKTPLESTGTGIYVGGRPGSFRASAGKGKLSTGWFKKEAKVYEEVYVSHLREPVIKGYLKDTKANKRRWCVLQGNRLHIFKTQDDPAIMIIDLLGCDIGVDDKKKISYSFRLTPKEGPGVSLAIEDGQDLSPWMSAIMAAVVRRGSIDRPNSPLDGAQTLEQARAERRCSAEVHVDGEKEKEDEELENFYELPVDNDACGTPIAHSTPAPGESDEDEDEGYNPPLPPLPIIDDYSSSESSSDEDESIDKKEASGKAVAKKKVFDEIPVDLLAELTAVKRSIAVNTTKSQDSMCEDALTNDQSMDLTDSHSEHSGNISNRHSYSEALASDDTGSSEPKDDKTDGLSRKRTSTVLSISMDSICSDTEETRSRSLTSESSLTSKGAGPKVKRRRKLVPAEAELQFLRDPAAMHSGILYQKRRLGVWSKRYCKIIDSRFKCYRNPADQKSYLDLPILGYDINLMDSKDSKKSYCIKISHPSQETHYFATDSRVSIERWIEVLSLAATGRLDVIAPYPPYFCAEQSGDELKSRSRESLLSSEGQLSGDDSADTLDDLDAPSERDSSLKRLQTSEEQSSFAAYENSATMLNEASLLQTGTGDSGVQQVAEGEVQERVYKKRKEKPSDKEGTKTPSTMSPPHSMFISESADGQAKPEPMDQDSTAHAQGTTKGSTEDFSSKKDKRWTENLIKKKLTRGHSYDYRLRGIAVPSLQENAKNKHQSMRRKNSQTLTHLLNLFDKEGRFCGNLTEVKQSKFSTTHLRRWCVVKNGVLNLFNSESEDTPQDKLSLVDMWLTDKSDESRNKFVFSLADKEGKQTIFQTTVKEDYQKWVGVLKVFTELRVERPPPDVPDPLGKADSGASDLGDGNFERGTLRSKSARAATKLKDEIYALAPGKVRTSLRMKLSQKVNVRDIFRKTHSSYDLEGTPSEGPSSALPDADVDTLAVFGGLLTQVEPNTTAVDGQSRWCTIKDKELLVFPERKATDPVRKIPLVGSVFSNLSDKEGNVNRFQVHHGNEKTVFEAWDQFDLNRWLRMLASVTEYRNSSDDERPKCVGRLTSPTFTKKKILHRRTRSEALQEEEENKSASTAQWYTKTKEGSSSSTDRLMSGYLQEVREAHGARTLLRRWCVATSEKFIVYDNQNSKRASFEWELAEMEVQDQSDLDAGTFGFCVLLGREKLCFKLIDEDSARHWLSVLARYCHAVPANQPLVKPPSKWRSTSREDRRRSASDNDLKSTKNAEKETNALEVLSEGRASGRMLTRRATEDSTFFRKFRSSELFKTPWRASSEKLEVKMRERPGRSGANQAWKRFSCGSLFDSEGKYSGYLMELITSELYSSQVRRWCLQKDDDLYVYENEATEKLIKAIPLFDAKVVDLSDFEACVYRFRIDYGDNKSVFFRALTRTDLEKWTTIISVKTAVLQDRSERRLIRSRTLSLEQSTDDISASSESDVASSDVFPAKVLTVDSTSLHSPVSICSGDSVFIRSTSEEEKTSVIDSAGLKVTEDRDESSSSTVKTEDEQSTNQEKDDNTDERTLPDSQKDKSNGKTGNRLSSIEDLSHIYENFLAFASEMAEKSPEFQEQLYHVYENVTQAFESLSKETTQEEGELLEKGQAASTDQKTNVENEVGSPSVEINSEFEKISLREKEDRFSTYSGICGETELEKLEEENSEMGRSVTSTLAEHKNENSPEVELLSGSFAGETGSTAVTGQVTIEGELLKVTSNNKEGAVDNLVVGVTWDGVVKAEAGDGCEKCWEIEEAEVVENCLEDSDEGSQVKVSQTESVEDTNGAVTDVVEFNSQTLQQDEGSEEDQIDVSATTIAITPTLVHADHVSTVQTTASSFYLVQEVTDHVWREIDSDDPRESVIETNVQISTTAEFARDRDFSALVVVQSVADEGDDGIAGVVDDQDPMVEGKQGDSRDDTKCDSSNLDQYSFATGKATRTINTDVRVNSDWDEQFGLSKPNVKTQVVTSENQDLGENNSFSGDENVLSQDSDQAGKSSLSSLSFVGDVQADSDNQNLQTGEAKLLERNCGAVQSVCAAESFEASVPLASTCSGELEVRCEHTVLSAVSESEQAHVWEEAVARIDEEPGLTTQDLGHETTTLQESPSSNSDQGMLCDKSNELDDQYSNPETEGLNTATNDCPEESCIDDVKTQASDTDPEQCADCFTKCPSNQEGFSPKDAREPLEGNSDLTKGDFNESKSADSVPKNKCSLNCGTNNSGSAKAVYILPPSESDSDAAQMLPESRDSEKPSESDNSSKDVQTWSNNSNLDDTQSLTTSQMDILKAVTAAFEEILELHGDDSDVDDTKL